MAKAFTAFQVEVTETVKKTLLVVAVDEVSARNRAAESKGRTMYTGKPKTTVSKVFALTVAEAVG